jgi:hypothetical protein
MIEAIGYLAMAFTIGSFLAKEMATLRLLNLAGCFWWIVYGFGTGSVPVLLVNSIILIVHTVALLKAFQSRADRVRPSSTSNSNK